MPNRSTDELFQLIKSLETSEKRLFKLYIKRSTGSIDLKMIQLFDALDKMNEYDEKVLLEKNKGQWPMRKIANMDELKDLANSIIEKIKRS